MVMKADRESPQRSLAVSGKTLTFATVHSPGLEAIVRWTASTAFGQELARCRRGQYIRISVGRMSRRFAAYAVCIVQDDVLLALHRAGDGGDVWSLPGGGVEQGEDPIDTVVREFKEESGCDVVVESLLGVDSRRIDASESFSGDEHQNIGVFYAVRMTSGEPSPQPGDDALACVWRSLEDISSLRRSSVVDIGIRLAIERPPTGHVAGVPVRGLIQH